MLTISTKQLHRFLWSLIFLLTPAFVFSQVRRTVNGTVRDQRTGETLIGASIVFLHHPNTATLSNAYGFYSINSTVGPYQMVVSFAGYRSDTVGLYLSKDTLINVNLPPGTPQLQEVVVTANKNTNNVSKPLMGVQKLSISEIKDVPVIFGEKDILKTIQMLPDHLLDGIAGRRRRRL